MSLGSLRRTFWGSEGRAPLGLDSPPLSASDGETEGCSKPPNLEGHSWKLGLHLPSPSPSAGWAGTGGQNFSSFAQRAACPAPKHTQPLSQLSRWP